MWKCFQRLVINYKFTALINAFVIHVLSFFVPFTILIFSIFTDCITIYIKFIFSVVCVIMFCNCEIAVSLHLMFVIFKMYPSPALSAMIVPEQEYEVREIKQK